MRVLLADLDQSLLCSLHECLTEKGIECVMAIDGLECVSVLQEMKPDVLVLGWGLLWGGSEGVMALAHEDPALASTPVIIMSEHDPRKEEARDWGMAFVGWLQKPFTPGELARRIDEVCLRATPSDESHRWCVRPRERARRKRGHPADHSGRLVTASHRHDQTGGVRPCHGVPGSVQL